MMAEMRERTEKPTLPVLATWINEEHRLCVRHQGIALEHARHAGEMLDRAKGLVPHGRWKSWLEKNFAGSQRTAQEYMRIYRNWPRIEQANARRGAFLSLREARRLVAKPRPKPAKPPKALDEPVSILDESIEAEGVPLKPRELPEIVEEPKPGEPPEVPRPRVKLLPPKEDKPVTKAVTKVVGHVLLADMVRKFALLVERFDPEEAGRALPPDIIDSAQVASDWLLDLLAAAEKRR